MIFVDTSFWVAFRNRRDKRHQQAVELLGQHGKGVLVTSNYVRGETWTFLRRRAGHPAAVSFLQLLERSNLVRIEHLTSDMESKALRWLCRHHEREYSFVDASSFALMKSLRIREALAFDEDFAAAGFVELRP